jgi:hypothetical protein
MCFSGEVLLYIQNLSLLMLLHKTRLDKKHAQLEGYSWWLQKIYKFCRYLFIAFYYYLFPFVVLVFQTFLLYAGEMYTKSKEDDDAD